MAPVYELVSVLARDDEFLAAVERVRQGADVDEIASRYVWYEGRTRRVFREVLTRSAATRWVYESQPVLELAVTTAVVDAPLEPGDPTEWPHAKRHREAAEMVARIGARRCVRCGTRLARDGNRRRYCTAHEPKGRYANVERSDREAITNLLNAAGDALEIA